MIKERVKSLRGKRGYAQQKEFAAAIGVSPARYNQYENGTREPDHAMLALIAKKLDTSVDYLLGVSNDPAPPRELLADSTKKEAPYISDDKAQEVFDALVQSGLIQRGEELTPERLRSLVDTLLTFKDYIRYKLDSPD
jgi:transcriptional regulator with XRE-family HTH domain